MNKYLLNINGKEVTGVPGQTILEVAKENDISATTRGPRSTAHAVSAYARLKAIPSW